MSTMLLIVSSLAAIALSFVNPRVALWALALNFAGPLLARLGLAGQDAELNRRRRLAD